jgi:hypothetical protein
MKEDTVVEPVGREAFTDTLTDVLRIGAQQLLQQAVEIEFASFFKRVSRTSPEDWGSGQLFNVKRCQTV